MHRLILSIPAGPIRRADRHAVGTGGVLAQPRPSSERGVWAAIEASRGDRRMSLRALPSTQTGHGQPFVPRTLRSSEAFGACPLLVDSVIATGSDWQQMTHKRRPVGPRVAGVEAKTFSPHRVSCRKASTGLRTRSLARVDDCERYCNGSCRTNWAPPTESVVLGSGPRPSAKARSSTRRPCSNPGRP